MLMIASSWGRVASCGHPTFRGRLRRSRSRRHPRRGEAWRRHGRHVPGAGRLRQWQPAQTPTQVREVSAGRSQLATLQGATLGAGRMGAALLATHDTRRGALTEADDRLGVIVELGEQRLAVHHAVLELLAAVERLCGGWIAAV